MNQKLRTILLHKIEPRRLVISSLGWRPEAVVSVCLSYSCATGCCYVCSTGVHYRGKTVWS